MKRSPLPTLAALAALLAVGAPALAQDPLVIGPVTTDADNTLSADRPILSCPVAQEPVQNGARPDPELFEAIIQCGWGEKPAAKGYDGAVTVDVTSLRVGAPRKWRYLDDSGDGTPDTTVYPVKAAFTEKTFYRTRTNVSDGWIRIFNFFVDSFGEWRYGSQENIKGGVSTYVDR